ncbi:hypothetical protein [Finegoldia magna]|uniref:hypothetical protein n=1 Tax=Finegoldia magna TaxID=1260 RepID=UPI00290E0A3B|nr:hypothetical protein [Finegoldia magna]MDU4731103.1 hypothetical protein [Finegoldia magna]
MRYDGEIREKLNHIEIEKECKIFPDVIKYKLAYDKIKHRTFKNEEIIDYINLNYLNNSDPIIEENVMNDLITFKTYKIDREAGISHFDIIQNGLSIFIAAIIGAISFSATCLASEYISKNIIKEGVSQWIIIHTLGIFVMSLIFYITIALFRVGKNSMSSELKFINYAIYTLETIKEDMEKNENSGMRNTEMNINVNEYQSDEKTDEKITKAKNFTKNDEGRYDGLELTEVREIRTYKATKNKYSPRAMYERKRR